MKLTPINAWPVAQDADAVNQYPTAVDDPFKADLDRKVIPRFASAAARDAAIPSPQEGMHCYLLDANNTYAHDGTDWVPRNAPYGAYLNTSTAGLAVGWSKIPFDTLVMGDTKVYAKLGDGGVTIKKAGSYLFTVSAAITAGVGDNFLAINTGAPGTGDVGVRGTANPVLNLARHIHHTGAVPATYYVWAYTGVAGAVITGGNQTKMQITLTTLL